MEQKQKSFPTEAVCTAATGWLLCDIDHMYEILNWMTDDELWTHQLPRAFTAAKPVLADLYPDLETDQITEDNWEDWRDRWLERYGPTMTVPRIADWQHRNSLDELVSMVGPERVMVVVG